MTKFLIYAALLIGLISMIACEDVVDLEVEDAPDLITVDAWVNNLPEAQTIKLTNTQQYFANTFNPTISGATVQLSDDLGNIFDFVDQGNGAYTWTPILGETLGSIGTSFELNIEVEGKSLSAQSILNPAPPVDSITFEFRENETFFDDGFRAEFFARDFVGLGNTYWIKTFRDGVFLNDPLQINIAFDAGFDSGAEVDGLIFIPPIRDLANPIDTSWVEGEMMKVEIHSISNAAFGWMEIARDQIINGQNGIFAEPLANARGNIINNTDDAEILGIFNVAEISSLEKRVE